LIILVFIFGAAIGSFVACLKDRLEIHEPIFVGRSMCLSCRKKLTILELIPVFSFIFLKGRCNNCKKIIPLELFLTEAFGGFLALIIYNKLGISLSSLVLFTSLVLFFVASLSDIREREVDLRIFLIGIFFALFYALLDLKFIYDALLLFYAVISAAIVPAIFYVFSKERWMGLGDVFFAVWAGLICLFPMSLVAIALAFFIGALFGIIILLRNKKSGGTQVAFGPFIFSGTLIALFYGEIILNFYLKILGI